MSNSFTNQGTSAAKVLVVLSVAVLLLAGLQPFLWSWVKNRSIALHELRIQAEQIEEVKKRTKEMKDNYNNQKIFVAQLDSVVPQSRNALQVIERLETATQGLNVKLEVSRIDEGAELKLGEGVGPEEPGLVEPVPDLARDNSKPGNSVFPLFITVTVTGKPEALVEYIDVVEHVQELSYIQKFTISPAVSAQNLTVEDSEFQLLMTVVFYLQGQPDGSIE